MIDNYKKILYFKKLNILFESGLKNGKIITFDDNFYKKMDNTIISCIPVSIHIKHLKPTRSPGKCYERSLYMFMCFSDALLVRGNNKNLELRYGEYNARHGWIEMDNYVYDPSLLMKIDKDLYYEMFIPTNINKCTKEEYLKENKDFYNEIKNTTVEDFKPNGKKRYELGMIIPLLEGIINNTNNVEFRKDLDNYLEKIEYNEEQIYNEINNLIQNSLSNDFMKI